MGRRQQTMVALGTGLLLALGFTTIVVAQEEPRTLQLVQQNNSGISGTATFTRMGAGLRVELRVTGAGAGPQPAHIHEGSCTNLNPTPQFSLLSVTNGTSTTDVQTTLQALTSSPHAIHMHKSQDELSVYVACADITPSSLPATGEADGNTGLASSLAGLSLVGLGVLIRRISRRRASAAPSR